MSVYQFVSLSDCLSLSVSLDLPLCLFLSRMNPVGREEYGSRVVFVYVSDDMVWGETRLLSRVKTRKTCVVYPNHIALRETAKKLLAAWPLRNNIFKALFKLF